MYFGRVLKAASFVKKCPRYGRSYCSKPEVELKSDEVITLLRSIDKKLSELANQQAVNNSEAASRQLQESQAAKERWDYSREQESTKIFHDRIHQFLVLVVPPTYCEMLVHRVPSQSDEEDSDDEDENNAVEDNNADEDNIGDEDNNDAEDSDFLWADHEVVPQRSDYEGPSVSD